MTWKQNWSQNPDLPAPGPVPPQHLPEHVGARRRVGRLSQGFRGASVPAGEAHTFIQSDCSFLELGGLERCRLSPAGATRFGAQSWEPASQLQATGPHSLLHRIVACEDQLGPALLVCGCWAQMGSLWCKTAGAFCRSLCFYQWAAIGTVSPDCVGSHHSSLAHWLCERGMSPGHHLRVLWG